MSFSTANNQPRNTPAQNSDLTQRLSSQIFKLSSLVNKPEVDAVEFKIESKEALAMLESVMASQESQMIKKKLSNDLNMVLSKFKQHQQQAKKQIIGATRSNVNQIEHQNDQAQESTPLLAYDKSLETQIQINETIILERELDLVNLETSIAEVNEIFRDLGTLVNEQQFLLGIHDTNSR